MKNEQKTNEFNKDLARVIMENIEHKQRYFGDHKLSGRPIQHCMILTPHSRFVSCAEITACTKELLSLGLIKKVWSKGCRVLTVPASDKCIMERIEEAIEYQQALEAEEDGKSRHERFMETVENVLIPKYEYGYYGSQLKMQCKTELIPIEEYKKNMTDSVKAQIEKTKKDYAEKHKYIDPVKDAIEAKKAFESNHQNILPKGEKYKEYELCPAIGQADSPMEDKHRQRLQQIIDQQFSKEKKLMEQRKEDAVKMDKTVNRVYEVAKAVFFIALGFSVGILIGLAIA